MSFTPGKGFLPGLFFWHPARYHEPMKTLCHIPVVAAALLLAGGDDSANKTTASTNAVSSDSSPLSAPANYVGALGKGQQSATKTVDTARLNQAIQMFNVDHSRNPKDLNELVTEKYLPQIPPAPYGMKIVYDANTGTVKVVNQ